MIDRQKFADAAERKYKTVEYNTEDCQAFVEACAKEAGYKFNARGTNDMWRNYLSMRGNTDIMPLAIGDVVFKWREESNKLPERYRGDKQGDIYHIGIITGVNPFTVCHSANSKENGKRNIYDNQAALAKVWSKCGTLKNTAPAEYEKPPVFVSTLDEVEELLIEAQEKLKIYRAEVD